ncbi:MAG: hypothetical protein A2203_15505 [Chromatiales bacterium RIFOXYA1_FULL_46_5]|nr:MAG: hypothetical protein A2203_15505 [Chromatiales bacterium RIFOXYA1_FULL_46_5]
MRIFLLCLSLISLALSASTAIHVATPQSRLEASTSYYLDLLRLLLEKTAADYGPAHLVFEPVPASGSLWKLMLNNSRIDVHWLTPTTEIEQHLRLVPGSILYGGLGLRGLIIKNSQLQEFQQVKTVADLRRFTACQGERWPDVQVLHYAGLKVHTVQNFDSMLEMLHKGRCDYFPRSVIEGDAELRQQPPHYQDFSFFTSVLLYYPMPVHFYVNPQDQVLAARLEQGLKTMHDSGELLSFMQHHPVTRHVFGAARYSQSIIFKLHNPVLPALHQQHNPDFWLELLQVKNASYQ